MRKLFAPILFVAVLSLSACALGDVLKGDGLTKEQKVRGHMIVAEFAVQGASKATSAAVDAGAIHGEDADNVLVGVIGLEATLNAARKAYHDGEINLSDLDVLFQAIADFGDLAGVEIPDVQ